MSLEENKRIVRSYFEFISSGDIDAALALFAPETVYWVPGKSDSIAMAGDKTKEQLAQILRRIPPTMPKGFKITCKSMIAEGDRVAAEAESYGETVRGKVYNNVYHFSFVIRDGKIQAAREYFDTLHFKEVILDQ